MAKPFNLTAEINLRGPANIKSVVGNIKRQLGTISGDINLNIKGANAKNVDAVIKKVNALAAASKVAAGDVSNLDAALKGLSSSMNTVAGGGAKTVQSMNKVNSAVKKSGKNISVATTKIEEFGRQSGLAIKRFAAFSVVSGGIYTMTSAIDQATDAFITFDKEMVKLSQVTGSSLASLKSISDEISNLSGNLGVASSDLLQASVTLAQAGLTANETKTALEALAKSALSPSFNDMSETVEGSIAAMRQFGLSANQLESALGSVNAVAASFAVESQDIIQAIQRTGGVFASASRGVSQGTDSLNEFVALFTSIRSTTRESAETIATGLRTIFTRIQRGSTIEFLKQFGIQLSDINNKFVGPYEAIRRLSEGLAGLDTRDVRFNKIIEELGGFRQIGKVIPLIKEFGTAQDALSVAMGGSDSLAKSAAIAQQSLAVQFTKTRESFLALVREVGNSGTFRSMATMSLKLANGFIQVGSALKPLLPLLTSMALIKGSSVLTQFGSGFTKGIGGGDSGGGGGGGGGSGPTGGTSPGGGPKTKRGTGAQQTRGDLTKNIAALTSNTAALTSNSNAINALTATINPLLAAVESLSNQLAASGGKTLGMARGGLVPGSGNRDTVPAMLTPGEFVIRKKAVETLGAGNLANVNRYAAGGPVRASIESLMSIEGGSKIQPDYRSNNQVKNKVGEQDSSWSAYRPGDTTGRPSANVRTTATKYMQPKDMAKSKISYEAVPDPNRSEVEKFWGDIPAQDFYNVSDKRFSDAYEMYLQHKMPQIGKRYDQDPYAPLDFGSGDAKFYSLQKDIDQYLTPISVLSKRLRHENINNNIKWLKKSGEIAKLPPTTIYHPTDVSADNNLKSRIFKWAKSSQTSKTLAASKFGDQFAGGGMVQQFAGGGPIKQGEQFGDGGMVQKFLDGGWVKRMKQQDKKVLKKDLEALKSAMMFAGDTGAYIASYDGSGQKEMVDPTELKERYQSMSDFVIGKKRIRSALKSAGGYNPEELLDAVTYYQGGSGPLARAMVNQDFLFIDRQEEYYTKDLEDRLKAAAQYKLPKQLYSGLGRGQFNEILSDTKIDPEAFATNPSTAVKKLSGQTVDFPTFLSTSKDYKTAEAFIGKPGALMSIDSSKTKQKGIDVLKAKQTASIKQTEQNSRRLPGLDKIDPIKLATYDAEEEMVLNPNAKFKILSAKMRMPLSDDEFDSAEDFYASMVGDYKEKGSKKQKLETSEVDLKGIKLDIAAQMLNSGGMAASTASTSSDIQDLLAKVEAYKKQYKGIRGIKGQLGISAGDRTLDSLLRSNNIAEGRDLSRVFATLARLDEISANATPTDIFGLVGISPIGYSKDFDWNIPLAGGATKKVRVHARGLSTKYTKVVENMVARIRDTENSMAAELQYTDIFEDALPGGGTKLAFDFDETLASNTAMLDAEGKEHIPSYYDKEKVAAALSKARPTALARKLIEMESLYPGFVKSNTRVLTARPQLTAGLVADTLKRFGLPYDESDVTGVSQSPNTKNVPELKALNLASNERLIDDSLSNIRAARASGKQAFEYHELKTDLDDELYGQGQVEGVIAEKVLALLGAPLRAGSVQNRPIDYPDGLGAPAQHFDIPSDIPTEVKRHLAKDAFDATRGEIGRHFNEMAGGGQVVSTDDMRKIYEKVRDSILTPDMASKMNMPSIDLKPRSLFGKLLGTKPRGSYAWSNMGQHFIDFVNGQDVPQEQKQKIIDSVKNMMPDGRSEQDTKISVIGEDANALEGIMAHESFHDIQTMLRKHHPDVANNLDKAVLERKDDIARWHESLTDKSKYYTPARVFGSFSQNDARTQAESMTGGDSISADMLGMTKEYLDKAFNVGEAIPDLLRSYKEDKNLQAKTLLSDIFGVAGLNKDFHTKFAAGGMVDLFHGSNTGVNDNVLKSFKEKGALSNIAQGYGQGAGFYLYTTKDRAKQQAEMRVSGGSGFTQTAGDTSGRPMVLTFNEKLTPENFDLDYELQKNLVTQWLIDNYDKIKGIVGPSEGVAGVRGVTKKNRAAGIMSDGLQTVTAEGRRKTIYSGDDSDIRQGEIVGQIMNRLQANDSATVHAFESKIFEQPLGLALKYVGASALIPSNIETFANGGSAEDTVPALLTPGEFVINKQAAQKIGYQKLHKMNKADRIQGYNRGGVVGFQRFAEGGGPVRITQEDSDNIGSALDALIGTVHDMDQELQDAISAHVKLHDFTWKAGDALEDLYQKVNRMMGSAPSDIKDGLRTIAQPFFAQLRQIEQRARPSSGGALFNTEEANVARRARIAEQGPGRDVAFIMAAAVGEAFPPPDINFDELEDATESAQQQLFEFGDVVADVGSTMEEAVQKTFNFMQPTGATGRVKQRAFDFFDPGIKAKMIDQWQDVVFRFQQVADKQFKIPGLAGLVKAMPILKNVFPNKQAIEQGKVGIETLGATLGVGASVIGQNFESLGTAIDNATGTTLGLNAAFASFGKALQEGGSQFASGAILGTQAFGKGGGLAVGAAMGTLGAASGAIEGYLQKDYENRLKASSEALAEFNLSLENIDLETNEQDRADAYREAIDDLVAYRATLGTVQDNLEATFGERTKNTMNSLLSTINLTITAMIAYQTAMAAAAATQAAAGVAGAASSIGAAGTKAQGGIIVGYANDGTRVGGSGSISKPQLTSYEPKGQDKYPYMLAKGEFVINAKSSAKNSRLLTDINNNPNQSYEESMYAAYGGVITAKGAQRGARVGVAQAQYGAIGVMGAIGIIGGVVGLIQATMAFFRTDLSEVQKQNIEALSKNTQALELATKSPFMNQRGQDSYFARNIASQMRDIEGSDMSLNEKYSMYGSFEGQTSALNLAADTSRRVALEGAGFDIPIDQSVFDFLNQLEATDFDKYAEAMQSVNEADQRMIDEMYVARRTRQGAPLEVIKKEMDSLSRQDILKEAIQEIGKKNRDALKRLEPGRLTDELNLATANISDIMKAFNQKLNIIAGQVAFNIQQSDAISQALMGNASSGFVDERRTDILANPIGSTRSEFTSAVDSVVSALGGGAEATQMGDLTKGLQIMQKEIPIILRSMTGNVEEGGTELIRTKLESAFEGTNLSSDIKDDLINSFTNFLNQPNRKGKTFEQMAEDGEVLREFSKIAEQARSTLENYSKAEIDNRRKLIEQSNKLISVFGELSENTVRLNNVQVSSRNSLDKQLGIQPTFAARAAEFNAGIASRTGGTTDPATIAQKIGEMIAEKSALESTPENQRTNLANKNIAKLANNINQFSIALKTLANSSDVASVALDKIGERQQILSGQRSGVMNLLGMINQPEQLLDFTMQQRSYSRVLQGVGNVNDIARGTQVMSQVQSTTSPEEFMEIQRRYFEGSMDILRRAGADQNTIDQFEQTFGGAFDYQGDPQIQAFIQQYEQAIERQTKAIESSSGLMGDAANQITNSMADISTSFNDMATVLRTIKDEFANITQRQQEAGRGFASGGIVYAADGQQIFTPKGTDTVPAMLTPGEFVVNRTATQKNLPLLKSINSGTSYLADGGLVGREFDFDKIAYNIAGAGSFADRFGNKYNFGQIESVKFLDPLFQTNLRYRSATIPLVEPGADKFSPNAADIMLEEAKTKAKEELSILMQNRADFVPSDFDLAKSAELRIRLAKDYRARLGLAQHVGSGASKPYKPGTPDDVDLNDAKFNDIDSYRDKVSETNSDYPGLSDIPMKSLKAYMRAVKRYNELPQEIYTEDKMPEEDFGVGVYLNRSNIQRILKGAEQFKNWTIQNNPKRDASKNIEGLRFLSGIVGEKFEAGGVLSSGVMGPRTTIAYRIANRYMGSDIPDLDRFIDVFARPLQETRNPNDTNPYWKIEQLLKDHGIWVDDPDVTSDFDTDDFVKQIYTKYTNDMLLKDARLKSAKKAMETYLSRSDFVDAGVKNMSLDHLSNYIDFRDIISNYNKAAQHRSDTDLYELGGKSKELLDAEKLLSDLNISEMAKQLGRDAPGTGSMRGTTGDTYKNLIINEFKEKVAELRNKFNSSFGSIDSIDYTLLNPDVYRNINPFPSYGMPQEMLGAVPERWQSAGGETLPNKINKNIEAIHRQMAALYGVPANELAGNKWTKYQDWIKKADMDQYMGYAGNESKFKRAFDNYDVDILKNVAQENRVGQGFDPTKVFGLWQLEKSIKQDGSDFTNNYARYLDSILLPLLAGGRSRSGTTPLENDWTKVGKALNAYTKQMVEDRSYATIGTGIPNDKLNKDFIRERYRRYRRNNIDSQFGRLDKNDVRGWNRIAGDYGYDSGNQLRNDVLTDSAILNRIIEQDQSTIDRTLADPQRTLRQSSATYTLPTIIKSGDISASSYEEARRKGLASGDADPATQDSAMVRGNSGMRNFYYSMRDMLVDSLLFEPIRNVRARQDALATVKNYDFIGSMPQGDYTDFLKNNRFNNFTAEDMLDGSIQTLAEKYKNWDSLISAIKTDDGYKLRTISDNDRSKELKLEGSSDTFPGTWKDFSFPLFAEDLNKAKNAYDVLQDVLSYGSPSLPGWPITPGYIAAQKKPVTMATGGRVPQYLDSGNLVNYQPQGTDTVPAMLTPGEFVVNRTAAQQNLPLLRAINNGAGSGRTFMKNGITYAAGGWGDVLKNTAAAFKYFPESQLGEMMLPSRQSTPLYVGGGHGGGHGDDHGDNTLSMTDIKTGTYGIKDLGSVSSETSNVLQKVPMKDLGTASPTLGKLKSFAKSRWNDLVTLNKTMSQALGPLAGTASFVANGMDAILKLGKAKKMWEAGEPWSEILLKWTSATSSGSKALGDLMSGLGKEISIGGVKDVGSLGKKISTLGAFVGMGVDFGSGFLADPKIKSLDKFNTDRESEFGNRIKSGLTSGLMGTHDNPYVQIGYTAYNLSKMGVPPVPAAMLAPVMVFAKNFEGYVSEVAQMQKDLVGQRSYTLGSYGAGVGIPEKYEGVVPTNIPLNQIGGSDIDGGWVQQLGKLIGADYNDRSIDGLLDLYSKSINKYGQPRLLNDKDKNGFYIRLWKDIYDLQGQIGVNQDPYKVHKNLNLQKVYGFQPRDIAAYGSIQSGRPIDDAINSITSGVSSKKVFKHFGGDPNEYFSKVQMPAWENMSGIISSIRKIYENNAEARQYATGERQGLAYEMRDRKLASKAGGLETKLDEQILAYHASQAAQATLASLNNAAIIDAFGQINKMSKIYIDAAASLYETLKPTLSNTGASKATDPMFYNRGALVNFTPRGTDTVPAMLTPGEFVVNRAATQRNLSLLQDINSGAVPHYSATGGVVPQYMARGGVKKQGGGGMAMAIDTTQITSVFNNFTTELNRGVEGLNGIVTKLGREVFPALSGPIGSFASSIEELKKLKLEISVPNIPSKIDFVAQGTANLVVDIRGDIITQVDQLSDTLKMKVYNQVATEINKVFDNPDMMKLIG